MAIVKGKTKAKINGKHAKKALTKEQKVAKRSIKIQKHMEHRKAIKRSNKGKVVPIKKKRQQQAELQIIDYTTKKDDQNITQGQVNILNLLGFSGQNSQADDWQKKLQQKLKQANTKSLQNPQVRRVYGQIGKIFATYRSGKVPKAFKVIPNLEKWKEVLLITRPSQWTPQAMNQAVNIFASNFDPERAEQFYRQFLVPAIKRDLAKNKKLNYHYYEALKKGLYKTNSWFKGIMFQFVDKKTLLREINVIQSLISKMTIPVISSSVALIKLTQMQPSTAILHYIKAFIGKSYNFPRKVISILTNYLISFNNFADQLPIVWHQLLLNFIRQYSSAIDQMNQSSLAQLAKKKSHKLITPQILKELSV